MRNPFSLDGAIAPGPYLLAVAALLPLQHAAVALAFRLSGAPLAPDTEFWVLPLRRLAMLPGVPAALTALVFASCLALYWIVAALSFRRANWSNLGHGLATLAVVPVIQVGAVAALALFPRADAPPPADPGEGRNTAHMIQGVLAGVALIVAAVFVSAVAFGAYGWGLFVGTPFSVGVTTAYLANRSTPLGWGRTMGLVVAAALLGAFALLMLALEGFLCILLIAPLAATVAAAGGTLGRALAMVGHRRGRPLLSVALLPAVFALEAASPPVAVMQTSERIDIAAPPSAVWRALTDDAPIASGPGLVGWAGLAYPVRAHLLGEGVGAIRLGAFSTGVARERVTAWVPGREFAFAVQEQPPAMEEMSPYRRVRAPHVRGYFSTGETRFTLRPLPGGGTRVALRATHVLRMDPVPYWQPLARWAVRGNVRRVLGDLERKAEETRSDLTPP